MFSSTRVTFFIEYLNSISNPDSHPYEIKQVVKEKYYFMGFFHSISLLLEIIFFC